MSLVTAAVLPSSREDFEEKLALYSSIPPISRIQIDVVDGKFVAPTSWPYPAPGALEFMVRKSETLPYLNSLSYEMDLMVSDALEAAREWVRLGATRLTFHAESTTDLPGLLGRARERYGEGANFVSGLISFGVALGVASDLALLEPII